MTSNYEPSSSGSRTAFFKIDEAAKVMKMAPAGAFDFFIDLCTPEHKCNFTQNYFSSMQRIDTGIFEWHQSFFIDRKDGSYSEFFRQATYAPGNVKFLNAEEKGSCSPVSDPFFDSRKNKF